MIGGVSAEEKRAITAHLQAQLAVLVDPDELTLDLMCAIEHIVIEAGRAERAMKKGDLMAAVDILRAAAAHVTECMQ